MKIKHSVFCIYFILLCLINYGQKDFKPGYIINNNNDTAYGLISLKSNYLNSIECEFKEESTKNSIKYSPLEIKAYKIENNKFYVSKEVVLNNKNQQVFLEYLVDGVVDLYYLKDIMNNYYFLEKDTIITQLSNDEFIFHKAENNEEDPKSDDGRTFVRKSNQYRGALIYLFNDAPDLKNKISSTDFTNSSLVKITKDYHYKVCEGYDCIDYTKSTKAKNYIEFQAGIINSSMRLKTSDDQATNHKISCGANFRLEPSIMHYVWNISTGIEYSYNNFKGDFENTLASNILVTNRILLKYSIVRIPIAIQYTIPLKRIQPFISISYNNIFLLNPEYSVYRFSSVGSLNNVNAYNICKFYIGFSGGTGVRYIFKNTSYIYIKSEFEYRKPINDDSPIIDYQYVNSLKINFGYGILLK